MAELDQSYSELEQPQYQPEPAPETGTELEQQQYQPEPEHATEHETKLEPVPEHEYEHENQHVHEVAYVHEHEEQEHAPEDEIQENSLPDEKPDHADEPVTGGAEKWPGWPGESVFRILVPAQKVGSIIGRKGEYIKKTCEETKARIKILDGPPGTRERAVMISAKEEPDAPLPPAIDGLLSIHKRVVDGLDIDSSHPPTVGKVSTRLLMPASQAGSLIGKQGTTVKSIQEESNCVVRVLGAEEVPIFALQDDRIVEVVGEATGIHKAIELIASHLRKFLVDRSIIPIIEMQMQMPNSQMEHMPPPPQHWGPPPQFFPPNAHAGPGYGASPRFMPPPRQFDNYYPPADMPPPPEKQHHQGISAFGRETQIPVHSSSSQTAAAAVITQVTQQMQIPLSYADAVIGTQGSSISYIRRVSGATVAIQETKGVPTEMTVEIGGTASQVQTAQQLIQNFMAEAAASQTQTQQAPPPSADQQNQVYNSSSYGAPYGTGYNTSSAPTNPAQGSGYPASGYGTNYGY